MLRSRLRGASSGGAEGGAGGSDPRLSQLVRENQRLRDLVSDRCPWRQRHAELAPAVLLLDRRSRGRFPSRPCLHPSQPPRRRLRSWRSALALAPPSRGTCASTGNTRRAACSAAPGRRVTSS